MKEQKQNNIFKRLSNKFYKYSNLREYEKRTNKHKRKMFDNKFVVNLKKEIVQSGFKANGTFRSAVEVALRFNKKVLVSVIILFATFSILAIKLKIVDLFQIALIFPLAYVYILKVILQRIFVEMYAQKNNLSFEPYGISADLEGRLFSISSSESMGNILSTTVEDFLVRIFNYQFTVGSGKSKETKKFTVSEISFNKVDFPYILLQSRSMKKYTPLNVFNDNSERELPLDKGFGRKFKLYAKEGYETEVFQIFSEELLTHLQRRSSHFSIEFSKNKIYIYDDIAIGNERDLDILLNLTKKIITSSGPFIERLHDDFDVLHEYYQK
jgi:hypothetical protein